MRTYDITSLDDELFAIAFDAGEVLDQLERLGAGPDNYAAFGALKAGEAITVGDVKIHRRAL